MPDVEEEEYSLKPPKGPPPSYYKGILTLSDLKTLDPHRYITAQCYFKFLLVVELKVIFLFGLLIPTLTF